MYMTRAWAQHYLCMKLPNNSSEICRGIFYLRLGSFCVESQWVGRGREYERWWAQGRGRVDGSSRFGPFHASRKSMKGGGGGGSVTMCCPPPLPVPVNGMVCSVQRETITSTLVGYPSDPLTPPPAGHRQVAVLQCISRG